MSYTGFYNVTAVNPVMTGADSGTSGVGKVSGITVTTNPATPSTRVVYGHSSEVNYTSSQPVNTGGWLTGGVDTVQVAGSGSVDKIATSMAVTNHVGTGVVNSALGYEAVVSFVGPSSTINKYAAFYVPNLSGVPNINRVTQFGGFINDYTESFNKVLSPFYNSTMQEFAPPYHPGLVAGRYYSAPHRYIGDNAALANILYLVPIQIPHRTTISKIGFNQVTATTGNARLAIYTAEQGRVQKRIWESAQIPLTGTGDKEQTVNVRVDAGTYWLCYIGSANASIKFHSPDAFQERAQLYGSASSTSSDTTLSRTCYMSTPYAAFPEQIAIVPTYVTAAEEPHLWFRV